MKDLLIFSILLSLLSSCSSEVKKVKPEIEWNQDRSVELNKTLAMEEEIQIKLFLEQHKDWVMTATGSGLQYYIYEKTNGVQPKVGQQVGVEVTVSLLDGTECYRTKKNELDQFVVDKSDIETGIQEAIKLIHVGDKAKLIIPSHLAHGLVGDLNKIPPLSVIVVDIHAVSCL